MDRTERLRPNLLHALPKAVVAGVKKAFHPKTLLIWLACSIVAAYSGPFGTYDRDSVTELLLTWAVLLGVCIVAAYVVNEVCVVILPKATASLRNIVFVFLCAPTIGALLQFMLVNVFGKSNLDKPGFGLLTLYATLSLGFIFLVRYVFFPSEDAKTDVIAQTESALQPASLPPHSRLAKRLNIPQAARIIHITAKGHFVQVKTCSETYQTRMRFLDAVDELDGTLGLTVHRSHWVHRDAIRGWVPNAKKPYVLLENESEIPVSKTKLDKVEQFGIPKIS